MEWLINEIEDSVPEIHTGKPYPLDTVTLTRHPPDGDLREGQWRARSAEFRKITQIAFWGTGHTGKDKADGGDSPDLDHRDLRTRLYSFLVLFQPL